MESYELTQAVMNAASVFHVRKLRTQDVLFTIRGEVIATAPRYHLLEGTEGKEVAELASNFIKTRYEVRSEGQTLGLVVFPAVAFKKTLVLTVGEDQYTADGGVFKGVFQCKAKDGTIVYEISKELSFLRDTFLVKTTDAFPAELPLSVALLSVAAIHSRFYDYI